MKSTKLGVSIEAILFRDGDYAFFPVFYVVWVLCRQPVPLRKLAMLFYMGILPRPEPALPPLLTVAWSPAWRKNSIYLFAVPA